MGIKTTKSVLATIVAVLVLTLAPQVAPASAAPTSSLPSGEVVCFFEWRHGVVVGIRCIAFRPIWPDCIKCDSIVIDYGIDPWVHDYFVDGFVFLDKAAHATDPSSEAAFLKAAQDRFMTVAMAVEGDVTRDTGFVDRKSGQFVSEPSQRLVEASAEIDAGLRMLRLAGLDPDGDPAIGMQHLSEAYERLASPDPDGDPARN